MHDPNLILEFQRFCYSTIWYTSRYHSKTDPQGSDRFQLQVSVRWDRKQPMKN